MYYLWLTIIIITFTIAGKKPITITYFDIDNATAWSCKNKKNKQKKLALSIDIYNNNRDGSGDINK